MSKNIFLKNVTDVDVPRKTGINICVFGDYDIAGNLTLITRLINKYTIHAARCIIVQGDYLDYDSDIRLLDKDGRPDPVSIESAEEIIREADFFHIGRRPVNFGKVDFDKILHRHNCVIQYFGSLLRDNARTLRKFHEASGIHGVSWVDWTMQRDAGFMHYHLPDIFDVNAVSPWYEKPGITQSAISKPDPVVISHSPTNRAFKQTDVFLKAFSKIKKDYNVELSLLEGLSNAECLRRKSRSHILFDQISVGRFALSAIESMSMGQVVLCSVSNIVQSVFPDNPVVSVSANTLEKKLRNLLDHPGAIATIGKAGRSWVERHCDPLTAIKQWIYLYDLIIHGNRIVEDDNFFLQSETNTQG